MIDIHSHIVFDVDDGPKTREDTRALLEESYRQGVRTIISTSHRRKGMFETPEEKISENFQEVKKIAAEVAPDLTIHYGAEIYFTNDVLKKLEKQGLIEVEAPMVRLTELGIDVSNVVLSEFLLDR